MIRTLRKVRYSEIETAKRRKINNVFSQGQGRFSILTSDTGSVSPKFKDFDKTERSNSIVLIKRDFKEFGFEYGRLKMKKRFNMTTWTLEVRKALQEIRPKQQDTEHR